jgi:Ca2+-binding RTX toxin-like protein
VARGPDCGGGRDLIRLDRTIFDELALGELAAGAFRAGNGQAGDAGDRILYDTDSGDLYYDADGSGTGAAAIHFATLAGAPVISHTDFFVVA